MGRGRVVDVETVPRGAMFWESGGRLVYANHFLEPQHLDTGSGPVEQLGHSVRRYKRLSRLLAAAVKPGLDAFKRYLSRRRGRPICYLS